MCWLCCLRLSLHFVALVSMSATCWHATAITRVGWWHIALPVQVLFDARAVTKAQIAHWDAPGFIRKSMFAFTDEICDVLNDFRNEREDYEQLKHMQQQLASMPRQNDGDDDDYDGDGDDTEGDGNENDMSDDRLHSGNSDDESDSSDEYGLAPFKSPTVRWAGGGSAGPRPKVPSGKGGRRRPVRLPAAGCLGLLSFAPRSPSLIARVLGWVRT